MTRHTTTPYCTERRVFFGALALLIALFGAYIYFVSASVVHVVVREETDKKISYVTSRIGDLESQYLAVQQAITEEDLAQYGFVDAPAEKVYVRKAPDNLVLVTHDES